jgi:hypothetical protein
MSQLTQSGFIGDTLDLHPIRARMSIARLGQPCLEFVVIGKQ